MAGWAVAGSTPEAWAAEKKGAKKKEATADDLFGDFGAKPAKGSTKGLDDLQDAMSGVKEQRAVKDGMAPKASVQETGAAVKMLKVFAAPRIAITSQGCVENKAVVVKDLEAPAFPYILDPFAVCARLESTRGRSVPVTFKIVTPKGRLVGSSEEVVDFTGKKTVEYVVDFPSLTFPVQGQYLYRLEVDGAIAAQTDLFEIKARAREDPASPDAPGAVVDEGVTIGVGD
jgi:hypothetical protein